MSSTSKIVPNIICLSMCECVWLFIFRYFLGGRFVYRPCDFLSGLDLSRTASSFSDTAWLFPHGDLPGSHENSSALTAKPAARSPRHLAVPAAKPTHHLPNRRIGVGYCYNRFHSSD